MRDDDLSTELKKALAAEQSGVDVPRSDFAAVASRGWRVRVFRLSVPVLAGLILLVGLWGIVGAVSDRGNEVVGDRKPSPHQTQEPLPSYPPAPKNSGTEQDQAEVFAIRALAANDLYDPLGTLYGFRDDVQRTEGGWRIGFSASKCTPRTCTAMSGTDESGHGLVDSWLRVALKDSHWTVTGVEGNFDEAATSSLSGYSRPQTAEPPHWEYPQVSISGPTDGPKGSIDFSAAQIWVGPMPSDAIGTACWPEGLNDKDEVVYRDHGSYQPPPRHDTNRGDAIFVTGMPGEGVVEVRMTCFPYTGPAWKVVSGPVLTTVSQSVFATLRVTWTGEPMSGQMGGCRVRLINENGDVIGTGREALQIWPASQSTTRIPVRFRVPMANPEEVVDSEVDCSLNN